METEKLYRRNIFRLYPTEEIRQKLAQTAGACRFIYNLALEQRRDWGRPGRKFSFATQCREVTLLRAEVDWLKAAPVHTLQQSLRDLDRAYQNWWAGRTQYPRPHKKGENDSFRFPDPVSLRIERTGRSSGRIHFPKFGWISLRGYRPLSGKIRHATVFLKAENWYVSIAFSREVPTATAIRSPSVGIDMGVNFFAALSDGTLISTGDFTRKKLRALRRAHRNISRKKRGSANRRKAVRRLARIQWRVSNARKDFLHKTSTAIAKSHGMVAVEALKVRNMTTSAKGSIEEPGTNVRAKAGLNRAILDQAWGKFRRMLAYKMVERGGLLVEVSSAYTSQTCGACGWIAAANRLDQARFACTSCGHTANADVNAAINILRRADSALKPVEGHRTKRPEEAGSTRSAA